MRTPKILIRLVLPGAVVLVLAGCQARVDESEIPESVVEVPVPVDSALAEQEALRQWELEFSRQRMIGDLLYDALNALQDDRLLTPVDDNAHGRYQRVLALDPENSLALEGLQSIVVRYIELAEEASRQGRYSSAQGFLDRARFVDQVNPLIDAAETELRAEANSGDLVFELNLAALSARSEEMQEQLASIANQAREQQAFLLITTPNDEQARWVYTVMRESVAGYRLRANIELGTHATIRLRMPKQISQETITSPDEVTLQVNTH